MKKFFGILLVLAGMASAGFGLFWMCHFTYDGVYYQSGNLEYLALIVLGLLCILAGRHLYRADGESPRGKTMMGNAMRVLGIPMMVLGAIEVLANEEISIRITGLVAALVGLVFLLMGQSKIRTGRIEVEQQETRRAVQLKADQKILHQSEQLAAERRARQEQEETPPPPPEPDKMVCPACGKVFPMDHVYCNVCGSLLERQP